MKSLYMILIILFMSLGAACSKEKPNVTVKLKVAAYSADSFERHYGSTFKTEHPDIQLEYIPLPNHASDKEEIRGWIRTEQPDVVVTAKGLYDKLADADALLPLDALAGKAGFNLTRYPDSILELLTIEERLYGLAPEYMSQALFYNKSIFDKNSLDYPRDRMSWQSLMELAALIPELDEAGSQQYGLVRVSNRTPEEIINELIVNVGMTQNLQYADMSNGIGTTQSKSWHDVWKSVLEGYESGGVDIVPLIEETDKAFEGMVGAMERYRPFVDNQAAMILAQSDILPLLNANPTMDWAMAAPPGDYQYLLQPSNIVSIIKQSPHEEEAWKLTEFVNNDETAMMLAASKGNGRTSGMIPASIPVAEKIWQMNLSALYEQAVIKQGVSMYASIPDEVQEAYSKEAAEQIAKILSREHGIEEALAAIQIRVTDAIAKSND